MSHEGAERLLGEENLEGAIVKLMDRIAVVAEKNYALGAETVGLLRQSLAAQGVLSRQQVEDSKVTTAGETINRIDAALTSHQDWLMDQQNGLARLREDLDREVADLRSAQGNFATLSDDVRDLRRGVDAHESGINDLKDGIQDLVKRLHALENPIT